MVSALLAAGEQAITALSELKYLLYGAAPMPLPMLRQALAAWPGLNFVQVYGQTELARVISALSPQAHRDASRPDRLLSAGTVLPGAEVRVVDPATGEDVAAGQPGEFWFRSPQRMMGYLNRPPTPPRRSPTRAGSAAATSGTSATAATCSSPTGSRT